MTGCEEGVVEDGKAHRIEIVASDGTGDRAFRSEGEESSVGGYEEVLTAGVSGNTVNVLDNGGGPRWCRRPAARRSR